MSPAPSVPSITEVTAGLSLPYVVTQTAESLYGQAESENLTRGRYKTCSRAAVVYLSCRICDVAVSASEVAEEFALSEKDVLKSSRHITKSLALPVPPANPATYIERYCTVLNVNSETRDVAYEILSACQSSDLISGSPSGVAASCLYGASVETDAGITQDGLADLANISPVTIRSRYKRQLTPLAESRSA